MTKNVSKSASISLELTLRILYTYLLHGAKPFLRI